MLRRSSTRTLLATLGTLALLAVPAHAADPLLSGYGGPGSGEQTLLGGGAVGGGSGSSGSGSGTAAANQSLRASTPAGAATGTAGASSDTATGTTRKHPRKRSSSSASGTTMNGSTTSSASSSHAGSARPGAPRVVAYPSRAGEVGGLPLSLGQALLVVLGVALLVLAVLGLRRLGGGDEPPAPTAQASVR
jgi:hypothetical protein